MAKQVQTWQSVDGKLYHTDAEATGADAIFTATQLASDLVDKIRPAYSDGEEMTHDLMRHPDLVIALVDALRAMGADRKPETAGSR